MVGLAFCSDGTVILFDGLELIAEVQPADPSYEHIASLASRFIDLEANTAQVEYVTSSGERKVWVIDPAPLDALFSEALSLVYQQRKE